MANQQQLEFAIKAQNDASRALKDVDGDLDKIQKSANVADREVRNFGNGLNDTADAGGDLESAMRGVTDIAGVAAEQFGVALPAGLDTALGGIMDFGGGVEALLKGGPGFIASLVATTSAIWAQVAALTAQAIAMAVAYAPIIAVVAAIALLVAGVILAVKYWDDLVERFPVLGEAADKVKEAFNQFVAWLKAEFGPAIAEAKGYLDSFTQWITGTFIPALTKIYEAIAKVVGDIVQFVADNWPKIQAIIEPALKALGLIIEAAWNQFSIYVNTALDVIKGIVNVWMGIFTGDWDRAWKGVRDIFEALWNGLKGTVENAIGLVKGLVPLVLEAGTALGNALKDGFIAGVKGTIGVIGNLADALLEALKSLINTAIDAVNKAIPNDLKISVLGKDIGVDLPDNPIPHLAAGGIVTRPTLALIGEAGPEAVIPLSRGRAAMGAAGGDVHIHIHAMDSRSFRDWLASNPSAVDAILYEASRRGA